MFLVGLWFHRPNFRYWIWPSLFLWGLDRFVSLLRMFVVNKAWLLPFKSKREQHSSCSVELVTPKVLRLRVKRPLFKWKAGQHAFITMPGVATMRYEQHPFTMANIPDESNDAIFLIRAQEGFTRRLVDRLESDKQEINCYLDGPYGTPDDYNHYAGVILLAGGTGVTHALSHFLSIIKAAREGRSAVASVRLVWNVRSASSAAWIAPMLNEAIVHGTGHCRATVDIYITRSAAADEPNADGQDQEQHMHLHHHVHTDVTATPTDTPMFSPNGSQENLAEKNSDSASNASIDKRAILAGFTTATASIAHFHRGRSHVESILRSDIDVVPYDAAGVLVTCCGPTELAIAARRAVCRVNTAGAILKGQNPVEFRSETFGW